MRVMLREPLSSSDARAAILSSHEELRGLVSETMEVAAGTAGKERDVEPLRTRARGLYAAFAEHMDMEERILPTALRDVIGLGAALRALMEEGHERQRAALASAVSALEPDELPAMRLIESVRAFADSILVDLKSEERYLLTADLDALTIDSHGG